MQMVNNNLWNDESSKEWHSFETWPIVELFTVSVNASVEIT